MPLAPVKPHAFAVIVASAVPSVKELSGAVSVKFAEVEPTGIVTDAGTVSREVLFDESKTVSAEVMLPEIETVPVPVAPSVTVPGSVSVRLVLSLSRMLIVAEPSVQLGTWAVIVAECVPLIMLSSTIVIVNVTEV